MIARCRCVVLCLALMLPFGTLPSLADDSGFATRVAGAVRSDFEGFYLEKENLTRLGIGLAAGAVFANTSADREIREFDQERLRGHATNSASKIAKIPGTALVTGPVYLGVYGAGYLIGNKTVETWAMRSARATLVGAPAALVLQPLLGGDRPETGDSNWRPFKADHGVSGHAFIGGIPLITAARMTDDPYLKTAFYGLSALPGLSRINDDAHYFSQAALGWFLAYLSCDVVAKGKDVEDGRVAYSLVPFPGGIGITARY
jgi:hypothetical protein